MKLCTGCHLEWPPEAFYEPHRTECKGCTSRKRSSRYADPGFRERHIQKLRERRAKEKTTGTLGRPIDPKTISVKMSPDGERFVRICPFHGAIIESVHIPNTAIVKAVCPWGHEIKAAEDNNHGGGSWLCWDVREDRMYAVVHGLDVTIMSWREKTPEIIIDSVDGRA